MGGDAGKNFEIKAYLNDEAVFGIFDGRGQTV